MLSALLPPIGREAAAAAGDDREQMLEERVRQLEQRLLELEQRHRSRAAGTATPRPAGPPRASSAAGVQTPPPARAATPETPSSSLQRPTAPPVQTDRTAAAVTLGGTPRGVEPAPGVGRAEDPPQEAFVFRENAVTLARRQFEVSAELAYLNNTGFLQLDRAFLATTAVRLGVFSWLELGLTIPTYTAARSSVIGPFQSRLRETGGLGDLALQANARLHEQTASTPGVVLSLGAVFPTGEAPYSFAFYQPDPSLPAYNPNPTNLTAPYFSRGAWGLRANLQLYKTVDPVILFAGGGLLYAFPQRVQGFDVQQGLTYTYNFGFSFALSERSTLGFQVNGAFQNKLRVEGRRVPESNLEPVTVRVSLIQRLFENTFLEPSILAGLTNNAPGLGIGLGVRQRF